MRIVSRCLFGRIAIAATAAAAMLPASAMAAKPPLYAVGKAACPLPKAGEAACLAMVKIYVKAGTKGAEQVNPGAGATGTPAEKSAVNSGAPSANATVGPAGGLTPSDLASAYGYTPTSSSGSSQTVAIVDAYDDPTIQSDLDAFDTQYGLSACDAGCFTKVNQTGAGSPLPSTDTGWSVEIALDVETVHAVCQTCKILLVEANSNSYADLEAATNEAATLHATEISNSYGGPYATPTSTDLAAYNHPGIVVTASTGDDGYFNYDTVPFGYAPATTANFPASANTVVAVGGTTLALGQSATRQSETVWNDNGIEDYDAQQLGRWLGAAGGGCAPGVAAQRWQKYVKGWSSTGCASSRLEADVAADADYLSGEDIYTTTGGSGWETVGGTSLASPLVAAQFGLAGGAHWMHYPALTLYGHLGSTYLYDVTSGGNGYCGGLGASTCVVRGTTTNPNAYFGGSVDCAFTANGSGPSVGDRACDALTGFDGPTGVGTPASIHAFYALRPTATIVPPASDVHATAETWSATTTDPFPGGTISTYAWHWGDGASTTVSTSSTTHTYAAAGNYTVTLTVTDVYGVSSVAATYSATVS